MSKALSKSIAFILLSGLCLFLSCLHVKGQERAVVVRECGNQLDELKELFAKGRLPEIERIIRDTSEAGFPEKCLRGNVFNKDEERELFELLTETFIYLNKEEEADEFLEKLLHLKPDYEVKPEKPDLNYLHSRFKVDPVFSLEFSFAPNLTLVNVLQRYSVDNTSIVNEVYTKVPGYSTGVKISIPVQKHFEISGGVYFSLRRYQYADDLITFPTSLGSIYGTLTYTESQSWIDLPVNARAVFPIKKYKVTPYIFGGFNLHFLLTADLKDLRRLAGNGIEEQQSFSLISGETDLRAKTNFSITGGLGIKYPVRLNYIFAELGYSTMVSNLVNTRSRYSNSTLLYKIGFVDNDFRLSNVIFTLGYARSFYNPELRRRYKKELAAYQADKKAFKQQKKESSEKEKKKKEKPKKEDLEEGKSNIEDAKSKGEEGIGKLKGFKKND